MYAHTYMCIYASMYLCIYVSMYICISVSMCLCVYIYIYIYVSMCLCIYVSMCIYIYICIYVSMYLCMYVCMYVLYYCYCCYRFFYHEFVLSLRPGGSPSPPQIQLSYISSKKHENPGCEINVRFSGVFFTKRLNEHFFYMSYHIISYIYIYIYVYVCI